MGYTDTVVDYVTSAEPEDLDEEVVEAAKVHIRDTVGVALGGRTIDLGDRLVGHALAQSPGTAATVIGGDRASPIGAAFANGILSNVLEWDDTPGGPHHLSHPSSTVLPASLAAAEHQEVDGPALLTGYVTGVEVLSRLELISFPDHYFHGWHDTATYGVFGAAVAAASILGLSAEATAHAIGMAASFSSGLHKNNSSKTKAVHVGHAAQNGLRAALLAADGVNADPAILDDDNGFLRVYAAGNFDPAPLETFSESWHLLDYGFKPYPGSTFNHAPQVALRRLLEREGIDAEEIERVIVHLDPRAWENLWVREPSDPFEARKAPEFNLAAIMLDRDYGIEQYDASYVTSEAVREQMAKVERREGFDRDDVEFSMFGAAVIVETTDGRRLVELEPQYSPLEVSEERLREKFRSCSLARLDPAAVDAVDDWIENLDDCGDLKPFFALLQGS